MSISIAIGEFILSQFEVGLCLLFADALIPQTSVRKYQRFLKIISFGILGTILFIYRLDNFINHVLFPVFSIAASVIIAVIDKKSFLKTLTICLTYFSSVGLLQIYFSFIALLIIDDIWFYTLIYWGHTPWRLLVYFISCIAFFLIYYFISRHEHLTYLIDESTQRLLIIYGIFGWWFISWGQMNIFELGHTWGLWLVGILLFTFTLILIVAKLLIDNIYKKTEDDLDFYKRIMYRRYYNDIKKLYENSLFTTHDFKNHIIVLRNYAQQNDTEQILNYLDKIGKPMERMAQTIWCDNEIINLIVNTKLLEASEQQIHVTTAINDIAYPIDDSDLCSILSNLLDNAIEANLQLPPQDRWMNIRIQETPLGLTIRLENATAQKPVPKKKWFVSTKSGHQGYGLKSVKNIVFRYKGKVDYEYTENTFCTNIFLPRK